MTGPAQYYPTARETAEIYLPASAFDGITTHLFAYTAVGETHEAALVIPADINPNKDIEVHVLWGTDQTTADSATWLAQLAVQEPEAGVDLTVAPATGLDTAIPADTASTSADVLQKTDAGVITGGSALAATLRPAFGFTTSGVDQLVRVVLSLELDAYAGTLPGDVVHFAGVVVRYSRASI